MEPPATLRGEGKFEEPPPGEDWLWWHPVEPEDPDYWTFRGHMRTFRCDKCAVRWDNEISHDTKSIRCFCCGRFVRKPKI